MRQSPQENVFREIFIMVSLCKLGYANQARQYTPKGRLKDCPLGGQ